MAKTTKKSSKPAKRAGAKAPNKKQPAKPQEDFSGGNLAIGIAIGVALGAAMDNIGAGIAIGVALGVAMGAAKAARK